jgi:chromosome partitioning protein
LKDSALTIKQTCLQTSILAINQISLPFDPIFPNVEGMIWALANSKGGVGKSTLAVHLAVWLREKGRRVAFVDSDVQGSSSAWLREAAPDIQPIRLLTAEDIVARLPQVQAQEVIVDGPAGLSEVTRAILFLADAALLPCGPSILDLRAAIDAAEIIQKIQAMRHNLPRMVIIPNKLQSQYRLSKELLQTIKAQGMPAGEGLALRQAYADAAGQGTVVWRMRTESARAATAEMQFLFQQLYESIATPHHDRRPSNSPTAA